MPENALLHIKSSTELIFVLSNYKVHVHKKMKKNVSNLNNVGASNDLSETRSLLF